MGGRPVGPSDDRSDPSAPLTIPEEAPRSDPGDQVLERGPRVVGLRHAGGEQDPRGAEVARGGHVLAGRDAGAAEHVDVGVDGVGVVGSTPTCVARAASSCRQ